MHGEISKKFLGLAQDLLGLAVSSQAGGQIYVGSDILR